MRVRQLSLALDPADLLFHELHLHERAPILIGTALLSRNEVHRQDVLIVLCTALAFLIISEQAAITRDFGPISLAEK